VSLPFLLEIGTEEIPDWMIVPALNNLQDMFQALLDQHALGGRVTTVDATPRRLVLRAEGLLDRQADVEELVMGPSKTAGAGAATGFAKKMGTTPDQLATHSTAKGEYFAFAKRTQGQLTEAVLAREAGLAYASLSVVVNHAAGRGDSGTQVELSKLSEVLQQSLLRAVRVLEFAVQVPA